MSRSLNINGSEDPFYRYKMPGIQVRIVGRGNGKNTVLTNLEAVARALRRPPMLVAKHLALSSSTELKHGGTVLPGWHSADDLQRRLEPFINDFVLCPVCGDCGTKLFCESTKKSVTIQMRCGACNDKNERSGHAEPTHTSSTRSAAPALRLTPSLWYFATSHSLHSAIVHTNHLCKSLGAPPRPRAVGVENS